MLCGFTSRYAAGAAECEESERLTEASASEQRRRLRAATRTNHVILMLLIAAVAYPLFVHYTGLRPAAKLPGLGYPRIYRYPQRLTPGLWPNHGIDFSQIWLSAQRMAAGEPVYFPVSKKKWRRKWSSTYHPFTHALYLPLTAVSFRTALITHNLLGIGAILLAAGLALRRAGCSSAFPSVAATTLALMYLTPTGLLHLERGQLDTFVATAIICCISLFSNGGRAWAVATGLVATLKVPAWVFVGYFWAVAACLWGLRERLVWWLPATIVLVNLIFLKQVIEWVPAFLYVANDSARCGPSLTRILPHLLSFSLPLISALAVGAASFTALRARGQLADAGARRALLDRIAFPFAAALTLQTVTGTPVTHDYRLVAVIGLLPVLAIWCARGEGVPGWLRGALCGLMVLAIVFGMRVRPFMNTSYELIATVLLGLSLGFLAAALFLALRRPRPAPA